MMVFFIRILMLMQMDERSPKTNSCTANHNKTFEFFFIFVNAKCVSQSEVVEHAKVNDN